jgi:stearoyl-CoA desaturase (delta-9 desaturase)
VQPPRDGVPDLEKDKILVFQDRYYVPLALGFGFVLPTLIGALYNGWVGALGGFLILGVARIVAVQQSTFFINSLCHTIGDRPYSSTCSARDSWLMALFTFGEGYHNYHHEFQHDYRNGVKWWQWDPTKWTIWTLEKLGMTSGLRRVPEEKILLSQMAEARRRLDARLACELRPLSDRMREMLQTSEAALEQVGQRWATLRAEYSNKADIQIERAREVLAEMRRELRQAMDLHERAGAPA